MIFNPSSPLAAVVNSISGGSKIRLERILHIRFVVN